MLGYARITPMNTRIVFMGSPVFALTTLKALGNNYQVAGVVTQPDRPAGRGRVLKSPPVKTLAQELEIPVIQPRRLRDPEALEQLNTWKPDLIVVAAFGQILPPEVLDLPIHGSINVHASLLPRWRGAAPIQAAILHGDSETGITIMKMDPGLDTGPILSQRSLPISPDDTAGTLSPRLAELGAELLIETLPSYLNGDLEPHPQHDSQATYAPMLKKGDGELDFTLTASELERRVRAFSPWPSAFTKWRGKRLKVFHSHAVDVHGFDPGQRTIHEGLPALGTGQGLLVLDEVQPASKKPMPAEVFMLGARDWLNDH